MRYFVHILWILTGIPTAVFAQNKTPTSIYIPLEKTQQLKLSPRMDTLDNNVEYAFHFWLNPKFTVAQLNLDGGLGVRQDSILKIIPNSKMNGGIDTATLKIVISSGYKYSVLLYKQFFVRTVEKIFPNLNKPKINIVRLSGSAPLVRNKEMTKEYFLAHTVFYCYANELENTSQTIRSVTISLVSRNEQKHLFCKGDHLSKEMVREIRKIRIPTVLYFRLEVMNGKRVRSVWNRIIITNKPSGIKDKPDPQPESD